MQILWKVICEEVLLVPNPFFSPADIQNKSDVLLRHSRQQHGQLSPHSEALFSDQLHFDIAHNPFHISDVYDDSLVSDHRAALSNESALACEFERGASFLNYGTISGPRIEKGTGTFFLCHLTIY